VQRRRGDIRKYLSEDTAFPSYRESHEAPYELSSDYAAFFDRVLAYARGRVSDTGERGAVRQRVRWWSALALLRAVASSPVAAAATLQTRASTAAATSVEEANQLGRAAVLDTGDDDGLEGIDTTPGADTSPIDQYPSETQAANGHAGNGANQERRRLLDLARTAKSLAGPAKDRKLALLIAEIKGLLADGYDPIVFCRFIDTADYVAGQLQTALGASATVDSVTGTLPPDLRESRIAELTAKPGRHVLVATDCLSEGVNLQEHFQAVVHYDLAWNPTRHEQREGRVDRFGQPRDIVRAVTIYGRDNRIDGIVLDVLIRKAKAIRAATGVSVPVPDDADSLVQALVEGLLVSTGAADQMTFDLGLQARRDGLHRAWESAAETEHLSRTKYAQEGVHPDEVLREVTAARAALGDHDDIQRFTLDSLRALGTSITTTSEGWKAPSVVLPPGLCDALPLAHSEPLVLHRDLPAPRNHAVLARTDPTVEAVARYVLDTALDPALGVRIASRAGVARTRAVTRITTLLLLRFRLHLDLPSATGLRQLVAEEARFVAFAGPPNNPAWLPPDQIEAVLAAQPDGNVDPARAVTLVQGVVAGIPGWRNYLDGQADVIAAELLDAHRRVRTGAGAPRRGLAVVSQKPVDLLGVYIFVPMAVK
jgi:hypothetical protein